MVTGSSWSRGLRLVVAGTVFLAATGFAQEKPMPDAQIESNVLKALAGAPELADQAIGTTTVYGTVTITGSVRDEASRDKAEQIVANTPGVKKVVDELTIGAPAAPDTAPAPPDQQVPEQADQNGQGSDPNSQADGAMTAGGAQQQSAPPVYSPAPVERSQTQQAPYQQSPEQANGNYPPSNRQPQPYRPQQAGQPVTLPVGAYLRVRVNQSMDSRHTQAGAAFDGVVINDVVLGGAVAVPRGALVQGQVVAAHPGGDLRGRGGLALQLTQITLEGQTYPLATEAWSQQGYDKTGQTVGTTVGLGAMGAMIGAIAGGGPGALLGAGIGGVAGLGLSSASHQGEAAMPAEAIVNFRLKQQAAINTVSQAELDRLAATMPPPNNAGGQPPQMRRRYPPPPPPPYAYGPGPYPYPYYYYPYR